MASKIFLDANILLDFTLKREGYDVSKEIIQRIINGDFQGFITPSIIHIAGYWLTKAYGAETAKKVLLELLISIEVIDCNYATAVNALNSAMSDIEDSLQYYTALHHKLDFFITRDKDLRKSAIPLLPIYSPSDFLKEFTY